MMKKRVFLLISMLAWLSVCVSAQQLGAFIADNDGSYTNLRDAPKGKIIDRIPNEEYPMIGIEKPTNGWWKLIEHYYYTGDGGTALRDSTASHWIHYSVLAVNTRNYGGQMLYLRKSPKTSARIVFKFKDERTLRPMDYKDGWVKVQTEDKKYVGWIEEDWLCGNSLTNCC